MTDVVESPSHLIFVLKSNYFWRLPALERMDEDSSPLTENHEKIQEKYSNENIN